MAECESECPFTPAFVCCCDCKNIEHCPLKCSEQCLKEEREKNG